MKRCVSIALALLLAFTTIPALALEPSDDSAAPAVSDAVGPDSSENVDEVAPGSGASQDDADKPLEGDGSGEPDAAEPPTGPIDEGSADQRASLGEGNLADAAVVEVELGDFVVRATKWHPTEPVEEANARLEKTLKFVADDEGSPEGSGTLVIDATLYCDEAGERQSSPTYEVSMKDGVSETRDSIEVHGIRNPSSWNETRLELSDVKISTESRGDGEKDRSVPAFAVAADSGALSLSLSGENSFTSTSQCAGIQKDNSLSAKLSIWTSDGAVVRATGGVWAAGIGGGSSSESIAGGMEFDGFGTVEVHSRTDAMGAAIGSGCASGGDSSASDIVIKGGTVKAFGGSGAGIGAGSATGDSTASAIRIVGGTVVAESSSGAGIGAGFSAGGDSVAAGIEVSGGSVAASGRFASAGIGSGWAKMLSSATNVSVSGGTVKANGGGGAPGIGSGCSRTGNSVAAGLRFSGDTVVEAQGGSSYREQVEGGRDFVTGAGAGIGSGWAEEGNSICNGVHVEGGRVTALAGADGESMGGAPGIGSGPAPQGTSIVNQDPSHGDVLIVSGGSVKAMGGTTALAGKGPQVLAAIGAGSAGVREVRNASIVPAEGLCANAWKGATEQTAQQFLIASTEPFAIDGATLSDAYLGVNVVPEPKLTVQGGAYGTDADGTIVLTESAEYVVTSSDGASRNGIRVAAGVSPTILFKGVTIDVSDQAGRAAFLVPADAGTVKLMLEGDNSLKSGSGCAGVQKEGVFAERAADAEHAALSQSQLIVGSAAGQGRTEGTLVAVGGRGGAGIGSGEAENGKSVTSNILIEGATITATGGGGASGIGSGRALTGMSAAVSVKISGGTVTAEGVGKNAAHAAGIGSGHARNTVAQDIEISGGTVTATGGKNGTAAGIGSGIGATRSEATNIAVSGGTVEAVGMGGGSGIGSGYVGQGGVTHSGGLKVTGGVVKAQGAEGGLASGECSYKVPAFGPSAVADAGDNPARAEFSTVRVDADDRAWYTSIWVGSSEADMEAFGLDKQAYPFEFDASERMFAKIAVTPGVAERLSITTLDGQPVDASEFSYDLESRPHTLEIKGSGQYRVSMAPGIDVSPHAISIGPGASPVLLLDNVAIEVSSSEPEFAALKCASKAGDVTLLLKGRNYLVGKDGLITHGVLAPDRGSLTIKGYEQGASLEAAGWRGGAGIGVSSRHAEGSDHSIVIEGADVTARSGGFGAGIGGSVALTGPSSVSGIVIRDSKVVAVGGSAAPGVGSAYSNFASIASNIVIERSTVTAMGGAGSPGIGSGYSHTGDSVVSGVSIVDSTVAATGGSSTRGGLGATADSVIGAGAGIGSGWSETGASVARDIVISGSTVEARGGKDGEGLGAGPGIGSGVAFSGASRVSGVHIESGTVVASGGTTARVGAGPLTLPGIGAGTGATRSAELLSVDPAEGLWANVWKGASADDARLFVENRAEAFSLEGVEDAYVKVALSAAETTGGGSASGSKPLPERLAPTGDANALPVTLAVLALSGIALCACFAVRRRSRR
ncbi:hypothetical protein [Paraeggerthella sp.]|uniref:hypothetical protein n=1 Tax=Paraeggerthella sp. TaxID=2897350 RepID=UPI0035299AA0